MSITMILQLYFILSINILTFVEKCLPLFQPLKTKLFGHIVALQLSFIKDHFGDTSLINFIPYKL